VCLQLWNGRVAAIAHLDWLIDNVEIGTYICSCGFRQRSRPATALAPNEGSQRHLDPVIGTPFPQNHQFPVQRNVLASTFGGGMIFAVAAVRWGQGQYTEELNKLDDEATGEEALSHCGVWREDLVRLGE
jgi:hypothetical protein